MRKDELHRRIQILNIHLPNSQSNIISNKINTSQKFISRPLTYTANDCFIYCFRSHSIIFTSSFRSHFTTYTLKMKKSLSYSPILVN
uniref:Ovule protein n=1 Tax=Meloidogyne incognita TaxID=6306 RepID=A0A914MYA8_MELIC